MPIKNQKTNYLIWKTWVGAGHVRQVVVLYSNNYMENDLADSALLVLDEWSSYRGGHISKFDCILSWKSKGLCTFKLKPLYTIFLHSIKHSGYRIGIKFDNDPLAVEQNIHLSKSANFYIVFDRDVWPRNPTKNFKVKNYLFGKLVY